MEFKVGDKVVIDNLAPYAGHPGVCEEMKMYVGMHAQITDIHSSAKDVWFRLDVDEDNFFWGGAWLRSADGEEKKAPKERHGKRALAAYVAAARRQLKEQATHKSVCSYALVVKGPNGNFLTQVHANDICHARMRTIHPVYALIDYVGKPKSRFSKKQYSQFLKFADYMFKRSWIKHAFLPVTVQSYIRNGVMINTELTATEAFAAALSLRMGSERCETFLPIFTYVTKAGYSEDFAFVMALTFLTSGKNKYTFGIPGSHCPISSSSCKNKILRMCKGDVTFQQGSPYKEGNTRWNLHNQLEPYGRKEQDGYHVFISKIITEVTGKVFGGWGNKLILSKQEFDKILNVINEKVKEVK